MKLKYYFLLLAAGFILNSCLDTDNEENCYYDECDTEYPTHGSLTVKANLNAENSSLPIRIYSGHYGEGELLREDTLYDDRKVYSLPSGVYYSVAAKYKTSDGGEVVVIDGDKIDVRSRKECDSTCYTVVDATVNVKLQY